MRTQGACKVVRVVKLEVIGFSQSDDSGNTKENLAWVYCEGRRDTDL